MPEVYFGRAPALFWERKTKRCTIAKRLLAPPNSGHCKGPYKDIYILYINMSGVWDMYNFLLNVEESPLPPDVAGGLGTRKGDRRHGGQPTDAVYVERWLEVEM